MTRRIRTALAAATLAVGLGSTAAVAAAAPDVPERRPVPGMAAMHDNPGMARMHELMTDDDPAMAKMHELMLSGHPEMLRMHEQMMPGVDMGAAHRQMMGGAPR